MARNPWVQRLPLMRGIAGLNDLFERVDDRTAFGEALANEEFERAAEMAGVSEAELYRRFEVAERDGRLAFIGLVGAVVVGLGLGVGWVWSRLRTPSE